MKITDGPWKLIMDEVGGFALVGGDGSRIADIHSSDKNAILLAHSMDLLDTLRAAVRRIEVANAEGIPILSAWAKDARKLIKDIEG